jgi:hypothetical protein
MHSYSIKVLVEKRKKLLDRYIYLTANPQTAVSETEGLEITSLVSDINKVLTILELHNDLTRVKQDKRVGPDKTGISG